MTNNSDTMIDKRKCNEIIQFADGDTIAVTYIGSYIGYINNNEIKLKNVLYIPEIKDKLSTIKIKEGCNICSYKMKNKPYKKVINNSKEPFELIHMDTVSSPDTSLYGNKYFLTILDDYTRYAWVYFMKSKLIHLIRS